MDATNPVRIKLVKEFTYRDAPEDFTNEYSLNVDAVPTTDAGWKALFDDLILKEKLIHSGFVSYVRAYGYATLTATNASSSHDYSAAPSVGTLAGVATGAKRMPGDDAATVRWVSSTRSAKGKPVYLRKYYHDVWQSNADVDKVEPAQVTALANLATALTNGWTGGASAYRLIDKHGNFVTTPVVSQWITTRTLEKRGKRAHPTV